MISLLALEGCEAFRKKFVRKSKKKKKEETQVVLQPQEYPEVVYDNPTLYKKYYNFWKASHTELIITLEGEQGLKKQLFYFDEVLKYLEGMKKLLADSKQEELDLYIKDISVRKEALSNTKLMNAVLPRLINKLGSIEKQIRIHFKYSEIEDWIRN